MHFPYPERNTPAPPNIGGNPMAQPAENVMGVVVHPDDHVPSFEVVHPADAAAAMIGTVSLGDVHYPESNPTRPAAASAQETPEAPEPGANEPPKPPTDPPKPTPGETPEERPGFSPRQFKPESWDSYAPTHVETATAARDLTKNIRTTIERQIAFTDVVGPNAIMTELECETPEGIAEVTLTVENGRTAMAVQFYEFATGDAEKLHTYMGGSREGLPILRRNSYNPEMMLGDAPLDAAVSATDKEAWGLQWEEENIPNIQLMEQLELGSKAVGAEEAAHVAHFMDRAVPIRVSFLDINNECQIRIQSKGPVRREDSEQGAREFVENVSRYAASNEQLVDAGGIIPLEPPAENGNSVKVEVVPTIEGDPDSTPIVFIEGYEPFIGPDAERLRQRGFNAQTRITVEYRIKDDELWVAHAADVVVGDIVLSEGVVHEFRGDSLEARRVRNFLSDPTYLHPSRRKFSAQQ